MVTPLLSATNIVTMDNISDLEIHLSYYTKDDLVLFDIDGVLIQTKEPAFQLENMKEHKQIAKRIFKQLSKEQAYLFLNLMVISCDAILVEQQTPSVIHTLIDRQIPTMALTAGATGKLAHIASMHEWKRDRLLQFGIDFTPSAPHKEKITFTNLPQYRDSHTLFQDGILFVNGPQVSKGDALIAFFKEVKFMPKKVVLIDDRKKNLDSVASILQAYYPEVEFLGLHYVGGQCNGTKRVDLNTFTQKWEKLAKQTISFEQSQNSPS